MLTPLLSMVDVRPRVVFRCNGSGFIVAGRVGTGLVVTRTEEGFWSAPSAIATFGMGYGALIGGEITDFVLVLNTDSAVEAFSGALK